MWIHLSGVMFPRIQHGLTSWETKMAPFSISSLLITHTHLYTITHTLLHPPTHSPDSQIHLAKSDTIIIIIINSLMIIF